MLRTEGHDAQCSDGEDAEQQFHLRVVRSGAERHEDGHADGQSHFGEHRGSAAIVALRCRTRMISSIERSKSLSIAG